MRWNKQLNVSCVSSFLSVSLSYISRICIQSNCLWIWHWIKSNQITSHHITSNQAKPNKTKSNQIYGGSYWTKQLHEKKPPIEVITYRHDIEMIPILTVALISYHIWKYAVKWKRKLFAFNNKRPHNNKFIMINFVFVEENIGAAQESYKSSVFERIYIGWEEKRKERISSRCRRYKQLLGRCYCIEIAALLVLYRFIVFFVTVSKQIYFHYF